MPLLKKRIVSFLIDYLLILLYMVVIVGTTLIIFDLNATSPGRIDPLDGQLIGFFSLTLPVVLYFFLSENSNRRGTIGKLKVGLFISVNGAHPGRKLLVRNILKFLPWEIAHTGVHQVIYRSSEGGSVPTWVMVLLLLPMAMVVAYVVSMFHSRGRTTLYDVVAGTRVVNKQLMDA